MLVDRWRGTVSNAMEGWPDTALTVLLIGVAVLVVLIALYAPPLAKPAALAWLLLP